jgi:tetratricopeptide (TPR) repeat protein
VEPKRGTSGLRERDTPPEHWEPEIWLDDGPLRAEAVKATERAKRRQEPPVPAEAPDTSNERPLAEQVGTRAAPKVGERIEQAARAFERERYGDVRTLLKDTVVMYPDAATARELFGLSLYRMGRFKLAIDHLEAHRQLTNSATHLPVLADCYRALRRYARVDELWLELREASPSAALVAEGRIVAAGALADRGKLREALAVMEGSEAPQKRPKEHHVRMWYVIGDLYDRAGDPARARVMFQRVQATMPGYADIDARLAAIGR